MKHCRLGFLVAIFFLAGCGQSRVDELESEVAELQSKVSELEEKLETAQNNASDLESNFEDLKNATAEIKNTASRFDGENWQDIVPDLQSAASNIEQKTNDLETVVSETVSSFE